MGCGVLGRPHIGESQQKQQLDFTQLLLVQSELLLLQGVTEGAGIAELLRRNKEGRDKDINHQPLACKSRTATDVCTLCVPMTALKEGKRNQEPFC